LPEWQWLCRRAWQFDPLLGRSFFTGSIVDNDGCAFGSELFGDVSADSLEAPVTTRLFPFNFPFSLCFFHLLFLCSFYFFSIDLDFLCVGCFEFIPLTDNARSDLAVCRRGNSWFPAPLECVFRLETLTM